jgi:hypothetical protein
VESVRVYSRRRRRDSPVTNAPAGVACAPTTAAADESAAKCDAEYDAECKMVMFALLFLSSKLTTALVNRRVHVDVAKS